MGWPDQALHDLPSLAVPQDPPRALPRRRLSPTREHRSQARPRRGLRTAPGDHVGPGGPQVAEQAIRPGHTACGAAGMGGTPCASLRQPLCTGINADRGSAHRLWDPAGRALPGADLSACAGRVAYQLSSPGHRRRVTLQPVMLGCVSRTIGGVPVPGWQARPHR